MPRRRRAVVWLLRSTSPERRGVAWWDLSEIAVAAVGFLLYFLVRGAVVDRDAEAFAHAHDIVNLEFALGMFWEPRVQEWILGSELLWRTMNFVYFWFDFPLIVGVGLILFWARRNQYTLLRDACLASGGLALVLYWSYPVAPPRFLTEYGFIDTLEVFSNLSYQAQSMQPFVNPYAAMPSLHVGWSLLLLIVVARSTRSSLARLGAVGALVLQSVSVVGTGNHYVLDGVVGIVVSLGGLAIAFWLQRTGYPLLRRRLAALASPDASLEAPRVPTRGLADR